MSEMLGVLITWILITALGFIAATIIRSIITDGAWQ